MIKKHISDMVRERMLELKKDERYEEIYELLYIFSKAQNLVNKTVPLDNVSSLKVKTLKLKAREMLLRELMLPFLKSSYIMLPIILN